MKRKVSYQSHKLLMGKSLGNPCLKPRLSEAVDFLANPVNQFFLGFELLADSPCLHLSGDHLFIGSDGLHLEITCS